MAAEKTRPAATTERRAPACAGSRAGLPTRATGGALGTLCLALALGACSKAPVASDAPQPVLAVTVAPAAAGEGQAYSGEVHARFETPLGFRSAGQLKSRRVHLGDTVRQGAILAELDPKDARAQLELAQAAVRAARERATLAGQTAQRNEAQARADLISQADLEQSRANLAVSEAELGQAEQQLALAQNQSGYASLVAPGDGVITAELAEAGSVLTAGQGGFGFAYGGERDVFIDVPENGIADLQVGRPASVVLWSLPDHAPLAARVREVAQAADVQSRTFRVKVALDHPGPEVRLGMTASVRLAAGERAGAPRLRIPASALFHAGSAPAVWLIGAADHKLLLRPVTVSGYGADEVFIEDGLAAGDQIVAQGVHTVAAGQTVAPTPAPVRAAAPARP